MRDATSQLADRLHLRRLRHLPLELAFLAIVLEAEQHGCLAQAPDARQTERRRLLRLVAQPDGDIARHLRPHRKAAHGVCDCCLIFPHDQIAGITRSFATLEPRRAGEGIVEKQDATIAIRHGKTERQQGQQRFDIGKRRCAARATRWLIDQQQEHRTILAHLTTSRLSRPTQGHLQQP